MILDHAGFDVADFAKSRAFYVPALAPLGIVVLQEGDGWAMVGREQEGGFWFGAMKPAGTLKVHLAFTARNRDEVRRFHAAALARRRQGQRRAGPSPAVPPELLRRLRDRPRRAQHRGGLPPAGVIRARQR